MNSFKRFIIILIIGILSSGVIFGYYGMILGFPSVLIASMLTTVFVHLEIKEEVTK